MYLTMLISDVDIETDNNLLFIMLTNIKFVSGNDTFIQKYYYFIIIEYFN